MSQWVGNELLEQDSGQRRFFLAYIHTSGSMCLNKSCLKDVIQKSKTCRNLKSKAGILLRQGLDGVFFFSSIFFGLCFGNKILGWDSFICFLARPSYLLQYLLHSIFIWRNAQRFPYGWRGWWLTGGTLLGGVGEFALAHVQAKLWGMAMWHILALQTRHLFWLCTPSASSIIIKYLKINDSFSFFSWKIAHHFSSMNYQWPCCFHAFVSEIS